MKYEQIVALWKTGYSKKYIIDMEYHSLKASGFYKRETTKQLKQLAYKNVEDTLLSEYRTRYLN